MKKEVIIEIDREGNISIEGKGFSGGACENVIAPLEQELGVTTKKTHKPEFYQKEKRVVRN